MDSRNLKSTLPTAIAAAVTLTVAIPVPAHAQLLDIATGALGILNAVTGSSNSQPTPPTTIPPQTAPRPSAPPQVAPRPVAPPQVAIPRNTVQPSPEFTVGTDNLNGNTINLCLSGCMPGGAAPIAPPPQAFTSAPQAVAPTPSPQTVVPAAPQPVAAPQPTVNNVPVTTPSIAP